MNKTAFSTTGRGALFGGLGGAAIGGLSGFSSSHTTDNKGRRVKRTLDERLHRAAGGALRGGVVGGTLGAAVGHGNALLAKDQAAWDARQAARQTEYQRARQASDHAYSQWEKEFHESQKRWKENASRSYGSPGTGSGAGTRPGTGPRPGAGTGAGSNTRSDPWGDFHSRQQQAREARGGYEGYRARNPGTGGTSVGGGSAGPEMPDWLKNAKNKKDAKAAYRDQMRQHHPDFNQNAQGSTEKAKKINSDWEKWEGHFKMAMLTSFSDELVKIAQARRK